jgi:hypothetical protein
MLIFAVTGAAALAAIGGGIWLEARMFPHPAQAGQGLNPLLEILAVTAEIPPAAQQRQFAAAPRRLGCDDLGRTDA